MGIIPKSLEAGDSVAIIAPSGSMKLVGDLIIKNIEDYFKGFGISVVYGKSCNKDYFGSGGTPAERANDIMDAFKDPKIKAIIPIFGGFTANQVLPYLDYGYIQSHPKMFMGYSDITAIDIAILSKTGMVTLLGPGGTQLGHYFPDEYTIRSFEDSMLSSKKEFSIFSSKSWTQGVWWLDSTVDSREKSENSGWDVAHSGVSTGISFGGNISTLALIIGTEFFELPKNPILFLEECGDLTEGWIVRYLEQFNQIGLFNTAKAVVFGRFEKNSKIRIECLKEIMNNYIKSDIPLVFNADFGHTEPMMTIPLGIKTTINTNEQKISFFLDR